VKLNTQRIGEIKIKAQPKTQALIEKAQKSKNQQDAIALLRKAVEIEPTSPIAVFNLGVLLSQTGKVEEGKALVQRSVKIDPDFTYGHASIALIEVSGGNKQKALEHLEAVSKAEIIDPDTAVIANIARVILAIQQLDLESAHQWLDMAEQINPKHPLIEHYQGVLEKAEEMDERYGHLRELQNKRTQRAHQKRQQTPLTAETGLRTCLEAYTKDMLIGCARFLRTTTYGNKGELADWLTGLLLDKEFLQETLDEDLDEEEREALTWMLETDGVRPWSDFTDKYYDDLEESTDWKDYEPDSIPGRLKVSGLLYTGTLNGQIVAFIPADVRPLLRELLKP
jgi:tetratricopeptide (TPR) repeat protein